MFPAYQQVRNLNTKRWLVKNFILQQYKIPLLIIPVARGFLLLLLPCSLSLLIIFPPSHFHQYSIFIFILVLILILILSLSIFSFICSSEKTSRKGKKAR